MVDLTPILAAIITVLGSVITAFVIPWLKTKISAEKQGIVLSVADAVEQTFRALGGEAKKEAVVERVKVWLAKYKITVDDTVINAAIERAVMEMNMTLNGGYANQTEGDSGEGGKIYS